MKRVKTLSATSTLLFTAVAAHAVGPQIPKAWDDQSLASAIVPLAAAAATPVPIPSKYYYGIPVRPVYKSYPVYRPDKEPAGYMDWLKQQEPQIAFDAAKLQTSEDWIRAGEIVFDAPIVYGHIFRIPASDLYLRDPDWYRATGAPVLKDGSLPFYRYVIREKGRWKSAPIPAACVTRG
jgi:hypothetical protein